MKPFKNFDISKRIKSSKHATEDMRLRELFYELIQEYPKSSLRKIPRHLANSKKDYLRYLINEIKYLKSYNLNKKEYHRIMGIDNYMILARWIDKFYDFMILDHSPYGHGCKKQVWNMFPNLFECRSKTYNYDPKLKYWKEHKNKYADKR